MNSPSRGEEAARLKRQGSEQAIQLALEGKWEEAATLNRSLLNLHLRHTWATARLSRSTRVIEAGVAAAARDQRVFDDLVDIGLGDGLITPRLAAGLVRELARSVTP